MSSNTLYSVVLTLSPVAAVTIGKTMGHQVHAAFLAAVREADPELAELLHSAASTARPFTVSPLQSPAPARDGMIHLHPEAECWLRLTLLKTPLYERFMSRFLQPGGRPLVRLGRAELLVREILTTPGAHPWAGYTTWAELVAAARDDTEITLRFRSPTAFGFGQKAWGKKVVLLPDPALVFGSLGRSWNQHVPPDLRLDRDELGTYAAEHVVVKQIGALKTQMLQFRNSPQVGFVGDVTYGLMGDDALLCRQLNAMAAFAFYAGVGMKTTMGMGQCCRK